MRGVKAQISLEYLLIVGFAFILLTPAIILFYTQQGSIEAEVSGAQAQKVMDELIASIDTVYLLGPPTKQTLTLRFPSGIQTTNIEANEIVFFIQGAGDPYELVGTAATNITGTISTHRGVHVLTITALENSVNITEN